MMALENYRQVFSDAWKWWNDDQAPRLSAALTFYAMLSLAPMILLAVAVAGFALGGEAAQAGLINEIKTSVGEAQATFVASLFRTASAGTGVVATIFSIGVLLFGASGLFEQLRDSVNAIWGLPAPQGGLAQIARRKIFAILGVSLAAICLLAWMILDARLQWLSRNTDLAAPYLWQALSFVAAWGFSAVVFAAMFKYLPLKQIKWRDVWFAGGFTALAFAIGKYLLSLYFAFASVSVAYGAAGALVVLLLWIYYSSQIFFFGVELSNAYAYSSGSLQGLRHDSKVKIGESGQVGPCPESGEAAKADVDPEHVNAPGPTVRRSLARFSESLAGLFVSIARLGKAITGRSRTG